LPAGPAQAAAGTVRTFVALSMVIVTSAVIPAATVAGTLSSETVTAYETTLPVGVAGRRSERSR
jgi:hypothetical protein